MSSSLHGIIFCDALNIPAYHLRLTDRIDNFKFKDYFLSVNRDYTDYSFNYFKDNWNDDKIENLDLPYYTKSINLNKPLDKIITNNTLKNVINVNSIKNNLSQIQYLNFESDLITKDNIDSNISVVISSCLLIDGKFTCLLKVLDNITYFLPASEIIIGFDKKGPNEYQENILEKYNKLFYFTHNKGLGHTFNYGNQIANYEIILQIEDDWIIDNKYINESGEFTNLLYRGFLILNKYKTCCVRLDGGMFDEIGGSNGYPLGWKTYKYNDEFHYYEFNLPTERQMELNFWLHYAFCNHPHLKFKTITLSHNYPENVNPSILENSYSVKWILNEYNIFYVPINLESLKDGYGVNNPDKNIFKHIGEGYSYRR